MTTGGMRILAVPGDENDILTEERGRLSAWAPSNGWSYIQFVDAFDFLSRIGELRTSASAEIAEIEIAAHGNPAMCNDVSLGNAMIVGESLRRVAGIGPAAPVYLSGCNTGLEFNGECVARAFAAAYAGPVYGCMGYLSGTHAERTEQCVASFEFEEIVYHSYPGGRDAYGDLVWRRFGSRGPSNGGDGLQIKIATSGFRAVNLDESEAEHLQSAVEQVLRTAPASSARMRMAPDLTFAIRLADGEHVFELLAGGTVLRDPVTRNVWQFDGGRAILQSLLPYRKLPAA